jgi:uncharacterized protein YndB with AHSA1/START domain
MKVEKQIELSASPERVWNAISEPAELTRWFPDKAELDLTPGGEGVFTWEGHGTAAVRIEVLEPPKHLVWLWMNDASRPFEETAARPVEWTLKPTPSGGTVLELVESRFDSQELQQDSDGGWDSALGKLLDYLDKVPELEARS